MAARVFASPSSLLVKFPKMVASISISTEELPRHETRPPVPPSVARTSSFRRLRPKTNTVPALEITPVSQGTSRPLESTTARSRTPARVTEGRVINKRSSGDCVKNRIETQPAALSECDYDTNPTELYLAIQNKKWDVAVKRCESCPQEAATWVSRRENDNSLRWRLLPLHAAIVFRASTNVVEALLKAYPLGARCTDDQGKYPLHLCFRRNCSVEAVRLLLDAFPQCVNINDDKGRAPMTLVSQSQHPEKERLVKLLENYEADMKAEVTIPSRPPRVQDSARKRAQADGSKDSLALCRPDDVCDEGTEIEYNQEDSPAICRPDDVCDEGVEIAYSKKVLDKPPLQRVLHDPSVRTLSSTSLEYSSTKPSIVDMAPASLREQMRERMERRREINLTGNGQTSSFLASDELASDSSVSVSSSICSSVASSYKISSTSQNSHSSLRQAQSAALPPEDKISTKSQKDGRVESFASAGMDVVQPGIEHCSKSSSEDGCWRLGCDEPEIYKSKSMLTQSTADLTAYIPISGSEEDSLGHDSRAFSENEGAGDLATPHLMKQAEQFFSSPIVGMDDMSVATYETDETQKLLLLSATLDDRIGAGNLHSDIEHSPSSSSATQSKFDRIMAKYDQLDRQSEQQTLKTNSLLGSARTRTLRSSQHGALRGSHCDQDAHFHEPSRNCEGYVIRKIGSEDSDAVSTLSRATGASAMSGMTTIGSISISTTNSAEVEEYVQSIVSNIVAKEIDGSMSMKAELEVALKNKIKLERKVAKLMESSKARYEELNQLRLSKHAREKEINREVEIHLARKASELQSCVKFALKQSEDAKQRAVKLAECKVEHEIRLLRSQLMRMDAEHNGITIDKRLQRSLEVVERNRKELLETAASDAQQALQMNTRIEESFSSAVKEFESWSDKHPSSRWNDLPMR